MKTARTLRPGRRHPLSLEGYIHRATRGLPEAERLDAAAELRTHLLERAAEHQTQGFSRDEAEFLAVRAMGDPHPVNRRLLGHALTHRAGWLTLGALLLGGLSWVAVREWMPPREGARFEATNQKDVAALFATPDAPRGTYQGVTLTYPKGTRAVVYVNVGSTENRYQPQNVGLYVKDIAYEEKQNFSGRLPGSYRYQERLLLAPQRATCAGQERAAIFSTAYGQPSRWANSGMHVYGGTGGSSTVEGCPTPNVRLHRATQTLTTQPPTQETHTVPPEGQGSVYQHEAPLRLNEWRVLYRLQVDPQASSNIFGTPAGGFSAKARGVYVAVLPLDRSPPNEGGYSHGAGQVQLTGDPQPLPPLPPLVSDDPLR